MNLRLNLRSAPYRLNLGRVCLWGWAVVVFAGWCAPVLARCYQDDPFGDTSKAASAGQAAPNALPNTIAADLPPIDPALDSSRRLIVETVRKSRLETGPQLAEAISTMLDIEQYADAKFYLETLSRLPQDDVQLFDLNIEVGSDFFLRVHSQPELQPLGSEFARTVLSAAQRVANDPNRLDELIRKLSDANHVTRQHAYTQLRRVGPNAVVALIHVFADPQRGEEFPKVRNALRSMGELALDPLLAAVSANDIQIRYESLLALARIRRPAAFDAVLRAVYATDTPAAIRDAVEKALEQTYGRRPSREKELAAMYDHANDQLVGRTRTVSQVKFDLNTTEVTAWRWDYSQRRLISMSVTPETAGRLLALDRAADLTHLEPENSAYRQLFLLAYFDAAKRLVGPEKSLAAADVTRDLGKIDLQEVDRVLHAAVDKNLVPAMAGACDLLGEAGAPELLTANARPACGLVRAIQSGDRHTQFAALRAIAKIDPKRPYAGSSHVLATAVFLAGYGDRPQALIGHNQIPIGRNLAVALASSSIAGRNVTTGREFFQDATRDSNLNLLVLCDSLNSPDYIELIQLLRADWRTKRLPILVLVERDTMARAERLARSDPRLIAMPLSLDEGVVSRQLERLRTMFDPWELTSEQGHAHARFAAEWLLKIVADRANYRFYNFNEHQQAIADLLYSTGHSLVSIEMLGEMGTPMAQRNLIGFASQDGMPIELRQAAVQAFGKTIEQFGVLLTSEEINLQYERYKTSGEQTGESQRVLGSILDLIENRAAKKTSR